MFYNKPNADFELLKFYSYTSVVQYPLAVYDEFNKSGERKVMRFVDRIIKYAEENAGIKYRDNKIVVEFIFKPTRTTMCVAYKDGKYTVGLGVHQWFGRSYDFKTGEWSEYKSETIPQVQLP